MKIMHRHRDNLIKSVIIKNDNYVPNGYYRYPELRNCWGYDTLTLVYSRNHMFIHIHPHNIKIVRRIHKWDKQKFPNGQAMVRFLPSRNGDDLAKLLHALDQTKELPPVGIIQYWFRKVTNWFR